MIDPLGLLLVVVSALAFAGFDALRKVLTQRLSLVPLLLAQVVGSLPLWLAWTALEWPIEVDSAYLLPGLGSVAANVVANLAYLHAVRVSGLSATIPLLSLTPVFTTLLAIPLLGEQPGLRQWLGILIVVAGALWLQLEGSREPSSDGLRGWLARLRSEPGGLWMILVAMLWSVAMPLDKLALQASHPAFHGLVLHAGMALGLSPLLLLPGQQRGPSRVRAEGRLLLAAVACGAVALGAQLLALERVWAGAVETLKRGIGNIAALGLGRALFDERMSMGKIGAVAMMALGVGVILI